MSARILLNPQWSASKIFPTNRTGRKSVSFVVSKIFPEDFYWRFLIDEPPESPYCRPVSRCRPSPLRFNPPTGDKLFERARQASLAFSYGAFSLCMGCKSDGSAESSERNRRDHEPWFGPN